MLDNPREASWRGSVLGAIGSTLLVELARFTNRPKSGNWLSIFDSRNYGIL